MLLGFSFFFFAHLLLDTDSETEAVFLGFSFFIYFFLIKNFFIQDSHSDVDGSGLYSLQLWVYLFIMGLLFIDLLLVFLVNFQK